MVFLNDLAASTSRSRASGEVAKRSSKVSPDEVEDRDYENSDSSTKGESKGESPKKHGVLSEKKPKTLYELATSPKRMTVMKKYQNMTTHWTGSGGYLVRRGGESAIAYPSLAHPDALLGGGGAS